MNKYTESNDGMVFTTTGKEAKNNNKKKEITCYKCRKTGHYSYKRYEEQTGKTSNVKRSSFLVVNDNQHNYSLDRDEYKNNIMPPSHTEFTALQGVEEQDMTEDSSNDNVEDGSTEDVEGYTDYDDKEDDESTLSEDDDYQGFAFLHKDVLCSTQEKLSIPRNWILLDSQSTVDLFSL